MTDNPYKDFVNSMTPAELKAFLRKITGPARRTLLGSERESMLLLLALKESVSSSNNQHTWCDVYIHDGKEYHITSFPGSSQDKDILEEILPDDQ
jgi:hypothetical protein